MSDDPVRLRSYGPHDLEACLRVFESNVPRYFRDHEREEFRAFLARLPGPYFVLTSTHGEVLGCGGYAVVEEERRADLCWGMVREDLHGTGLGRTLTTERVDRATADPAVSVVALHTSQHTRGFYEIMGFRTVDIVPDGYAPGLDRCEMRLGVGVR